MFKRVFFVVPPSVHLLDITGPAHIFYELAVTGQPLTLHYLSLDQAPTASSSAGLWFSRLEDFSTFQLSSSDLIFLPGVEKELLFTPQFTFGNQPFYAWLRSQADAGATICSVCTGAFLLAQAGILRARQCTTHWKYLTRFREQYPEANLKDNRLFVRDGRIWTSAGVTSGIDLALHLISESFSPKLAAYVAKETVVYLRRTAEDPQLSIFLRYRNHLNDQVHQAQDYLTQYLDRNCSLAAIAAAVNMSPRNLSRRFKQHTGLTVGAYLRKLRVEKATALLASGDSPRVVAAAIGLKSPNQLRALLRDN